MAYVKPGTSTDLYGHPGSSADDYLAVDGKAIPLGTAVQASNAGYGVIDPSTGTFEVLDALPLGRQAAQLAIESASTVDFATEDFLTAAEITASNGKIKLGAGADLT